MTVLKKIDSEDCTVDLRNSTGTGNLLSIYYVILFDVDIWIRGRVGKALSLELKYAKFDLSARPSVVGIVNHCKFYRLLCRRFAIKAGPSLITVH